MYIVINIVLPLILLLFTGFLLHYFNYISDLTADGMTRYLSQIAIPVLLFSLVVKFDNQETLQSAGGFLLVYFSSILVVWMLVSSISYMIHRNSLESIINGESAVFSNTVLLGLPIIFITIPHNEQAAIAVLLSLHLPIMTTITLVCCEWSLNKGDLHWKRILYKIANNLCKNPIIIGLALGLTVRFLNIQLPDIIFTATDYVKETVTGVGLLLLGINMHSQLKHSTGKWIQTTEVIVVITIAKLIILPLLVYLLATYVIILPTYWKWCAVIFASCPTGMTPWIHSNIYGTAIGSTSLAIAVSTFFSMISITFVLYYLTV